MRIFPLLLLTASALNVYACKDAEQLLKKFNRLEDSYNAENYKEVPGTDLSQHLAKTIRSREENISAILGAMNVAQQEQGNANLVALGLITEEEASTPAAIEADEATVLKRNQERKVNMDADEFQEDDNSFFTISPPGLVRGAMNLANDTVNWSSSEEEFVVSVAGKIPVKDQGRRGTCSSFAGIGQIEGLLLKKYSSLESIDLSEQRFYYMSKPEHWTSGGDVNSGGSNAGTGFSKSNGYEFDGHTFPPDSPSDYNLPLEAECPYNPIKTGNDLQIPQADGCKGGVAKITDFTAWVYNWNSRPLTAQEIYDFLLTKDYPVVVASKLSSNWEYNDGIITLAGSGGGPGDSVHASGHAYMIVGAKKLNESQFPGEGGMCFIIKNSWGTGWGVNGYSCMTLAWFNAWRYPDGFPAAIDVDLDPEKFAAAQEYIDSRPEELIDPSDDTITDKGGRARQGKARKGTATFYSEGSGFSLLNEDMEYGAMLGANQEFHKVLFKVVDNEITIRGIKDDNKTVTHGFSLAYNAGEIIYREDNYDDLVVGSLDEETKTLVLCSGDYLNRCYVRYLEESNELTIGLSKEEALKQKSEGPYDWKEIGLAGYGVDLSSPSGLSNKLDMRFKVAGKETNPLRFLVKPLSGDIQYSGKTVGNYQNFSMCDGNYSGVCRVVLSGDDFDINFKAADPGEE